MPAARGKGNELSEADARHLLSTPPDGNLVDALRLVIKSGVGCRWLTLNEAADFANVSVRSLQRELRTNGVVFTELVDAIRSEQAVEMLKDREMSLSEIAKALGYSTPSNFGRAFLRWKGVKPAAFRSGL
jgi:AraC-like DNA-binding protein